MLADLARVVGGELAQAPPKMHFLPRSERGAPKDAWWHLNPPLIQEFLAILGFKTQTVSYHYQVFNSKYLWAAPAADGEPIYLPLVTVVGRR